MFNIEDKNLRKLTFLSSAESKIGSNGGQIGNNKIKKRNRINERSL